MELAKVSSKTRRVLVFGCSGLIGGAVCRRLQQKGYKVLGIDKEHNTFLSPEEFARVDLSEYSTLEAQVRKIVNNEDIYGIVHAQTLRPKGFGNRSEEYDLHVWDEVLRINLTVPFFLSKILLPNLVSCKNSSIIFFSSIYGIRGPRYGIYDRGNADFPPPNPVSYSVAKSGILGLVRHLSQEWGRKGVRVNAISPGGVQNNQHPQFELNYSNHTALGRMATKEEVADAVEFLLSESATYITGQNLVVDGGWSN